MSFTTLINSANLHFQINCKGTIIQSNLFGLKPALLRDISYILITGIVLKKNKKKRDYFNQTLYKIIRINPHEVLKKPYFISLSEYLTEFINA